MNLLMTCVLNSNPDLSILCKFQSSSYMIGLCHVDYILSVCTSSARCFSGTEWVTRVVGQVCEL